MKNGNLRRNRLGSYCFSGDSLRIFYAKGTQYKGEWFLNDFGGDSVVPVEQSDPMKAILDLMNNGKGIQDGQEIKLTIDPRTAVLLYLSGKLTRRQLVDACFDEGRIRITEFVIQDGDRSHKVKLIIHREADYDAIVQCSLP